MEYISSDTNVWIDFSVIDRIELPFKLKYTYLMSQDAIDDELLSPSDLKSRLVSLGLVGIELTEDEFYLAEKYANEYTRLSKYDCIALAIAKNRQIVLLTGDRHLRNAASAEDVNVIGTIGILDQLMEFEIINIDEYLSCLKSLRFENGKAIRLPKGELDKRIRKYQSIYSKRH